MTLGLLWDRLFSSLPACPDGPFLRTVEALATAERPRVRVVCRDRKQPNATVYLGRETSWIVVNRPLLAIPSGVQNQVAAHEVGHIAKRHCPLAINRASWVWLGIVVAVYLLVPPMLDAASKQVWQWVVGSVVLLGVIPYVIMMNALRLHVATLMSKEVEADEFARRQGFPVTEEVASWFLQEEPKILRHPALRWVRVHPLPEVRLRLAMEPDRRSKPSRTN